MSFITTYIYKKLKEKFLANLWVLISNKNQIWDNFAVIKGKTKRKHAI